jgi:tetraprenyl-beta-curcumene synthase
VTGSGTLLVGSGTRRSPGAGSVRVFAGAARCYWLRVFPTARKTKRRLRTLAEQIPDPLLREDALISHDCKGSNSEGLAAMAVLAPAGRCEAVARSLVAYQLMLDYLDGVSERQTDDPIENGHCLHRAFEVALDPEAAHHDYYALAPSRDDGGYLEALIETCRLPLGGLPSYPAIKDSLLRQAGLCRQSQALNHALPFAPLEQRLDEWAVATAEGAQLEDDLAWWELVAAAAASSLTVGALMAVGAKPAATSADAAMVESAYFPWASGLNALLDSLVDLDEDPVGGSHLRRYDTPEIAAERLQAIAAQARQRLSQLPDGRLHEAIFAAMGALYLAEPKAWLPDCEDMSKAVFAALGPYAVPCLLVHVLRRGGRGGRPLLAARRRHRAHM